jgi:hypothetical protein
MKTSYPFVLMAALAACSSSPPPAPPRPAPAANARGIRLRENWRATVIVDRDDSIVLTMPTGAHQLQHFRRVAGLTLVLTPNGEATLRLDSMRTMPASAFDGPVPVGAEWSGRAGDAAIDALRVRSGGTAAAELTPLVRGVLPRLPASGAEPRTTWTDTGTGGTRSDIFNLNERRTAKWSAGVINGGTTPIRVSEEFEQLGNGSSHDGQKLTMTSQGRRTGTYYVYSDGRIALASLLDSAAVSIGVPQTRQVMSGTRYVRTEIRFIPVRD